MTSLKTSTQDNLLTSHYFHGKKGQFGFTIIEVVVSIGIIGIILALGLFLSMDFQRGYTFRYEENLVVSLLQKARSRSMANINQATHGFCWDADDYIIFEGDTCPGAGDGERIPRANSINVAPVPPADNTFVFQQLSGETDAGTITLEGLGKTASISINNEGAITY